MKSTVFAFFLFTKVFCASDTNLSECDPQSGRFTHGEHQIPADFLNESKLWNYKSWNKHQQKKHNYEPNSRCINLSKPKSLENRLEDLESEIDLMR